MKSAFVILVSALCVLNVAAAIVAESSSSSSSVASGTDSSARSFATSVAVGCNEGTGEPFTSKYESKGTSAYSNAKASAEAAAKVTMNNPSPGIVTDPCTFVLRDNAGLYPGTKPPSFASRRDERYDQVERHTREIESKHSVSESSDSSISAQSEQSGSKTVTFNSHGTITDVLTPSKILVGKEVVELNLGSTNPSDLYKGNYEILMDFLKEKLIGQEVFIKDNYAYLDLNGAINSVSINEMIQKEVWGKLIEQ